MANKPFDREVWNNLEKALSSDQNAAQTYVDLTLRTFIRNLLAVDPTSVVTGFLNASFLVKPTSPTSMNVTVNPGLGFIDASGDEPSSIGSVASVDDPASLKPLPLLTSQVIAIDAAPSAGNNRIDIIEVTYDRRLMDSNSRDILDPTTGAFAPGLVNKTLGWILDGLTGRVVTPSPSTAPIGYKVGAAATAGSEVAPAVTTGYIKIAEVHLIGGTTTVIASGNLTDERPSSGLVLIDANNEFTGTAIFDAAVTVVAALVLSGGNVTLTKSALQSILKGGTGGLDIGTSIASDLRVLLNNVAKWTFRQSDSSLVTSGGSYLHSASGNELEIIGSQDAGSLGNDILINTLVDRTAGWILRILNNSVPLYTFPSTGTPAASTDVIRKGDSDTAIANAVSAFNATLFGAAAYALLVTSAGGLDTIIGSSSGVSTALAGTGHFTITDSRIDLGTICMFTPRQGSGNDSSLVCVPGSGVMNVYTYVGGVATSLAFSGIIIP